MKMSKNMDADFQKAQREAESLVKKYGYTLPPIDPELIAEDNGLRVVYANFRRDISDKISGFLNLEKNEIVVNKDISAARKIFTIAHELGHSILHIDYAQSNDYVVLPRVNDYYDNEKPFQEKEADAFAANLLVPIDMLKRYKNIASISELAKMFCVSEAVIRHSLTRA
jgi:Zn-dependent peptidase ImmA (M78 family)